MSDSRVRAGGRLDPVYFSKTYYLGLDNAGDKPYRLLAQAMHQEDQAAVAQFVQRGKEELVVVRSVKDLAIA